MRLVLASASPRRRQLLEQAGFRFEVIAAAIDETVKPGEAAEEYVRRLAVEKAESVARQLGDAQSCVVLGADTTVAVDGVILNKPYDSQDAERMLRQLSGKTHQVFTGMAVVAGGAVMSHVEATAVTFRELQEEELRSYVRSGEPLDKAGAYGIQGYAARWIPRIEGDYFNVMGLPIAAVVGLLQSVVGRDTTF